jgi:glycolate oxidase
MIRMPEPDAAVLARRGELLVRLREAVPGGVIEDEASRRAYETDALTAYRQLPMLVVLPSSTAEVAAALKICKAFNAKVVPRGAGTSLSGGALPLADGVILGLAKLNRILDIDYDNRTVTCQTGVTNLAISQAVSARGFYYAPDPSSQIACTIGGNVAENSGGVHCLKYGLTTNNVLGVQASRFRRLRPARRAHRFGRPARGGDGSDGAHPSQTRNRARAAHRLRLE